MRLRVLGCHGGELPGCRTTCFLVDETLALDAGALTSTLSLPELVRLDHVLVGHSHHDHVRDLPLLADLLIGRRARPVVIHAGPACATALRAHLFNDAIWPDFTKLPSAASPVLRIEVFEPGRPFSAGAHEVVAIPVDHPIESFAFLARRSAEKSVIALSGDTGPTETLWQELRATKNLSALLVETSFPASEQALATLSGHLTPQTLEAELRKLPGRGALPVFLYHLKPAYLRELAREIEDLQDRTLRILRLDERFDL